MGADAGQRGWRVHAVQAEDTETFDQIRHRRALCGLRARYGWTMDLFIVDHCTRCEKAIIRG